MFAAAEADHIAFRRGVPGLNKEAMLDVCALSPPAPALVWLSHSCSSAVNAPSLPPSSSGAPALFLWKCRRCRPPPSLQRVRNDLLKSDLHETLLNGAKRGTNEYDHSVLDAIMAWLRPVDKGSLPTLGLRTTLFQCLDQLPGA